MTFILFCHLLYLNDSGNSVVLRFIMLRTIFLYDRQTMASYSGNFSLMPPLDDNTFPHLLFPFGFNIS